MYVYDTLLKRLPQDLEDVTPELRELIEEEHAVVRQRHLAQERHLAPTDQAHIRDRMVGGATWARRGEGGAPAGEAGDAMDAGDLQGFGQAYR